MKTQSLLLLPLLLLASVFLPSEAQAQSSVQVCDRGTPSDCATVTNGALDVNATVSTTASVTGWPGSTQTTGTPLAVTVVSAAGTLPAGTVVVLTNDDTTNTAFCKLGATATTSDTPIYPHSSVSFTVGSATQFACITATSTATVKSSGGAGLPTGWGGGSAAGGGGGGSVTQGTTPWIVAGQGTAGTPATGVVSIQGITSMTPVQISQATAANLNATVVGTGTFATQSAITAASGSIASGSYAAGSIASGAMVDLGAIADAAATAGSTGSVSAKLRLVTTQLGSLTLAQGSTTSGQTGNLILGAVTTGAPTYTTAQTSPLSLDTTGALRVNVTAGGAGGGAVTVADGADVTQGAKADAAAGTGTVSVVSILKQLHLDVTGAIPAGSAIIGKVGIDQTTPGTTNLVQAGVDVCANSNKVNQPISFQTTTLTQQIAASGSNKVYICSMSFIASAATVFSVVTGTGTNCGTGTAALLGTTSATHGLSLAANGGMTYGSGSGTVSVTGAGGEVCLVQSGSGDLVGNIAYVYGP